MLRRLPSRLRGAFPKGAVADPAGRRFLRLRTYEFFEAEKLVYVVGMAKNQMLLRLGGVVDSRGAVAFEAGDETPRRYRQEHAPAGDLRHEADTPNRRPATDNLRGVSVQVGSSAGTRAGDSGGYVVNARVRPSVPPNRRTAQAIRQTSNAVAHIRNGTSGWAYLGMKWEATA